MTVQTIPDSFIHFDTNAWDESNPMNVRDMQILNLNHNILLARRIRRPLVTQAFHADESAAPLLHTTVFPVNEFGEGEALWRGRLRISPFVQNIQVSIHGYRTTVTNNVLIYPYLTGPGVRRGVDTSLVMTVNSSTSAKYSSTVPVPNDVFLNGSGKPGSCELILLYCCVVGTSIKAPGNITSWGETGKYGWFEADMGGSTLDLIAYFSDTSIRPRVIREEHLISGTTYRVFIDGPWETRPVAGTTTVGVYNVPRMRLSSLSVYEKSITSFADDREDP